MKSNYYSILGLPETASVTEVKKRYYQLAQQFHPDKNPTAVAHVKFLEITEAYEIIIGKKPVPAQIPEAKPEQSRNHTRDKDMQERMREAKKRYEAQQKRQQQASDQFFNSLFQGKKWLLIRIYAVISGIMLLAFLLDFVLPGHFQRELVTDYAPAGSSSQEQNMALIKTDLGNYYWLEQLPPSLVSDHPQIVVERTHIMHDPSTVYYQPENEPIPIRTGYNFHAFTWLFILFTIFPLLVYFHRRKTYWLVMFYYLSYYFTPVILGFYLVMNKHIIHLLTAGFL